MAAKGVAMNEQQLLKAARDGDEDAFARLIGLYRRELYTHCYRMLGSSADAEDALQDALLGAWRGLPRFQGRSSLRSWLYTIATNACLRAIERRPKRVLPIDYGPPADPHDPVAEPLVESVWVEPFADSMLADPSMPDARYEQREAVEIAFIAAIQHLPARQRAVLLLRDVLGFSARETAAALDATPASIDSALQRAHKAVDARLPERSQQETLRSLDDRDLKRVVEGFVAAWERADVDAIVSMLAEDAVLAMPPEPTWFAGRDAIAAFLAAIPLAATTPRHRLVPTWANGQVAFGHYSWREEPNAFVRHAITVLSLRDTQIEQITFFRSTDAFTGFDLPEQIAPEDQPPG
jgi:RNA polymerase sigma-70 factor (ECF subfamily)